LLMTWSTARFGSRLEARAKRKRPRSARSSSSFLWLILVERPEPRGARSHSGRTRGHSSRTRGHSGRARLQPRNTGLRAHFWLRHQGFLSRSAIADQRLLLDCHREILRMDWVSATAQPTMSISLAKAQPAKLPGAVLGNQAVRDGELAKGSTNSTGLRFLS